jgi:hypothetical protein
MPAPTPTAATAGNCPARVAAVADSRSICAIIRDETHAVRFDRLQLIDSDFV